MKIPFKVDLTGKTAIVTGGWNIMHGWNTNGIRFLNFVR